ncbi:MAG: Ig-like domain-containing protein, partial [Clostridiales bacterium]|nr:Ig-like domain-containing protein [Clostridiales bacterium]
MYYFLNLTKRTVCILLCVALLLAYAMPSFAEDGDIQELDDESTTEEVTDGEYSADGESAQSTESDFIGEDAAQTASESGSDENSGDVEAAESAESEDDDNSSGSDEESASEDSAGNAESITFFALEANESGEAAEGNEEENQTEVEETVYAESITLSETSAELLVGSELELEAVITPDDATAEVIWLSGNEDVASVVSGKVTALSAGTATITATVDELEAVCEVTVYEEMDVAFVWTDEITTIVSVRKGTTAEALSIADMPDGEALDEYRTGEYDVAWYIDGDLTEKFDFTTEITEPITLYAKFLETLTVEYVWSGSQATVSTIFADSCADLLELGDAPEDIQALYDVRYQVIWYADELLTETYDFESAVTEDLTLYADYDFLPEMEWFADTTKSSYTLVTAAELQSLAALTAAGYTFAGVTIYLGEDETESNTDTGTLDLSGIEWEPIGTAEHPFAGTLDGGIYAEVDGETGLTGTFTLSGLSLGSYKEFDYAGLFGYVTGDICNVTVSGTVYVTAQCAGGIVGWLEGTITNCTNQTNVYNYEADGIIGGIAGYVNGSVYNCVNEGTRIYNRTDGNGIVGGIVGTICGYVTDSVNSGRYVTGKGYAAGGIAGALKSTSQVLRCTNSAQVGNTADSAAGGGIVGEMEESTTVQYCGNTGAITSTAAAGGIVGRLTGTGTVASCFNSGDVTYEKSSRGGGILGYSENGYENVISQCCNLSTQDGTFLDADYVTATTDAGEAAYIMDNGGSEERYDVWGWINGDAVPTLISMGSSQVYSLTLTAPKSIVTPLPQNYYPVGETIVIYAAKDLENGDEWIVSGFADYTVSEDLLSISFVMPVEDIAISVTVANQSKEYTITFYGYIDSDNEYTTYDSQSVCGGECVVAPEEQDGAADINAYYPYYEDDILRGYYVFMGWYLMDADGTLSEEYDFDWMVGTDLELYAEWSLVTVQFSFNGVKTTTSLPLSYKTGIGVSLPQPTPEPETSLTDTSFVGWSTEKSLTVSEMDVESEDTKLWKFDDDDEPRELGIDDIESMTLQFYAIWSDTVTTWATTYGVEGNGSQDKPFTITTDEQLNTLSGVLTEEQDLSGYYFELSNDGDNGGTFTLTNPIVGYHSYDYSSSADDYVFTISEFNGSFDGNDCTVDLSEAGFSLFGILGEDAVVSNLNLTGDIDTAGYTEDDDYYIVVSRADEDTGNYLYDKATGTVAAVSYGQIVSCRFEGTVADIENNVLVGGIVGASVNGGTVEDCTVSASEVTGGDIETRDSRGIAGGIVGAMYGSGTISNCTVTGTDVTGSRVAGGILGATGDVSKYYITSWDTLFEILNCKVETDGSGEGSVSTTVKYGAGVSGKTGNVPDAGGIAGYVYNTNIEDCENTSEIIGQYTCGGIAGSLTVGSITNCKNKGAITVEFNNPSNVGGIVGVANFAEAITASDNSGTINVNLVQDDDTIGYPYAIGGLVGACALNVQRAERYPTDSFICNISQCTNTGDIVVSSVLSARAIGGLIGQITTESTGFIVNVTSCTQSGDIEVSANGEGATFVSYI